MAYNKNKNSKYNEIREQYQKQREEALKARALNPNAQDKPKLTTAEKLKKNASNLIILGAVLLLIIIWAVSSYGSSREKYDIYNLNSQLNFTKMSADYVPFMREVADMNDFISEKLIADATGLSDADSQHISDTFDSILKYDIPTQLTNIKAAEIDFIVYNNRRLNNIAVDDSVMNKSSLRLSAAIAKVIR